MFTLLLFTLKAVWLYSHSIVSIKFEDMSRSLIFWNRISWFTVSNADFRSINKVQSFLLPLLNIFYLRLSVILRILSSQPIPFLKPVWLMLSFHPPLLWSSSTSLVFKIVSSSLYTGEVFVIGLALWKHFQLFSSFAMYSCSS